jgi:hypothetical protein
MIVPTVGQELNQQPRLIEAIAPVYPMLTVYSATTGDVSVRVEIEKSGAVSVATAIDGHKLLQPAAESAAKQWRFEPGISSQEARLIFSFRILPKEATETELSTRFRSPYNIEVRRVIPEPLTNRDPGSTVPKKSQKRKTLIFGLLFGRRLTWRQ